MAEEVCYGKLIIVGKDAKSTFDFPIDKKSILLGRDPQCDIRIVNKEISRKHAEVYVDDDTGAVFVLSMGREPVRVNGTPVTSPQELFTGDRIEVLLEGRTREFVYEGNDDTVEVVQAPVPARQPLGQLTTNSPQKAAVKASGPKPGAPPPAPPPPPRNRAPGGAGPPPPPPPPAGCKAEPPAPAGMHSALQQAIKAGVKLKKVQQQQQHQQQPEEKPASAKGSGLPIAFVPNPADLLKLKAGLRKTDKASSDKPEGQQGAAPAPVEQPAAPAPAAVDLSKAKPPAAPEEKQEQAEAVAAAAEPAPVLGGETQLSPHTEQSASPTPLASATRETDDAAQMPGLAPVGKQQQQGASEGEQPAMGEAGAEAAEAMDTEEAPAAADIGAAQLAAAAEMAAEAAADVGQHLPTTAKKRVRFHMEAAADATPEGVARDATMTIHLRKGDMRQIINVDADNTVAFSQWALGTVEEEAEEQLPATVTCKKSRCESSLTAPSSAGKTPMHSALRSLFGDHTMTVKLSPLPGSVARGPTPNSGLAAPATTPVTGAKPSPAARRDAVVIDATTLAAKLAEMARENDVTLELPAGTPIVPGSLGKEAFKVVLTPKSAARSGSGQVPASAPKSAANTSGKSRLSQMGAAEESAAPEQTEEISFRTMAVESDGTPVMATASVRKSASKTPGNRPQAAASAPRSSSRTRRVVIVERSTPASGSAAAGARSASRRVSAAAASAPEGMATATAGPTIGPVPSVQANQLSTVAAIQFEAVESGEEAVEQAGSADDTAEVCEPMVPLAQYHRTLVKAKLYRAQAVQLQAQLRKMSAKVARLSKAATAVGQALEEERAKRLELQEAMQQIVVNRAASEQAAAAAGQEEEQQAAGVGEEALATMEEDSAAPAAEAVPEGELGEEEEEMAGPYVPRVVVVRPAGQPDGSDSGAGGRTERAGCVVVVRASPAPAGAAEEPAPATSRKAPASAPRTVVVASARKTPVAPASARRTPAPLARKAALPTQPATEGAKAPASAIPKSALKSALKSTGAPGSVPRLVVDEVPLPDWLFAGPEEEEAQRAQQGDVAAALAAAVEAAAAPDDQAATNEQEAEAAAEVEAKLALAVDGVQEEMKEALAGAGSTGPASAAKTAHSAPQAQLMEVDAAEQPEVEEESSEGEEEEDGTLDDTCHVCGRSEEGDVLLLCDSCDNACHLTCCNPPLKRVPKGDWFCTECIAKQAAEAARSAKKQAAKRTAHPAPEVPKRASKKLAAAAASSEPLHTVLEETPVAPAEAPRPTRSRRASVAPAASQPAATEAGAAEEVATRPARGRRASVAPAKAAAPDQEAEEPAPKPSRGRRASVAAAPAQAGRRGRGAAALDAIVEDKGEEPEGGEQAAEEPAPKGKRQRVATGAAKEEKAAVSERTATRTTRSRAGIKQDEQEVSQQQSSRATRTRRSRR